MAFFIKDMDLIQNDNQNSDVHFQQNFKACTILNHFLDPYFIR